MRWWERPGVFWHNLGAVRLDVGGSRLLRVTVAHLNPYDPAEATVVSADWNTIGEDADYDEEPEWSRLAPHRRLPLLRSDAGAATVNGFDVAAQAGKVRASISLTGQFAAVDEVLSGRENLVVLHLDPARL